MAATTQELLVLDSLRGRNGTDPPWSLAPDMAVEALNVDWYGATFARKRNGATNVALTGVSFTGIISALIRHLPAADLTLAELWAIDDAATPIVGRLAGGTTWASPTLKDPLSGNAQDVTGVSFNGKLFLAYNSAQDLLHVWDGTRVRRTGMATAAAPTVANTGVGSYAATIRYYKVSFTEVSGSTIVRRGELSTSVSFTPSGTGTAVRVTMPALPAENETNWELWASADNSTFVRIANTVVGTTTFDDSTAPASYTGTAAPISGTNTRATSGKYLIVTDNRLLMAGAWASGGRNNRVWFTPALGSSGVGDDERVTATSTQSNWVDLDENDGGFITGFGGPLYSHVYVFKDRQIWKLVPTGDSAAPFQPVPISKHIGALRQHAIFLGEDEAGAPAIYFMSHRGPYRLTITEGPQFLGRDNIDIWSTLNLGATTTTCHGVFHADKHQAWFWIATGSNNDPETKMVFDVMLGRFARSGYGAPATEGVRYGWARHTGQSAAARCSVLFANTLGAAMSRDLKPYLGRAAGTAVWKADSTATDDGGTTFQAYVKTKPFAPKGLGRNVTVHQCSVLAAVGTVTLTLTLDRDFGLETRTSTVSLVAAGTENRTQRQIEGSALGNGGVVQAQLGDGSALSQTWTIDALIVPMTPTEQR